MNWKKLSALTLSAAMVLALAAPALAADDPLAATLITTEGAKPDASEEVLPGDGAEEGMMGGSEWDTSVESDAAWEAYVLGQEAAKDAPAQAVEEEPAVRPWYADAQNYMMERGLMTGTGKGFEPLAVVTRATVFQTLFNLENKPTMEAPATFGDVIPGDWYWESASWAAGVGLTTGTENGLFEGGKAMSRAELVTVLHRFAQYKGLDVTVAEGSNLLAYADGSAVAGWCTPAFLWACQREVITGRRGNDGMSYLTPDGTATRAELAVLLTKLDLMIPTSTVLPGDEPSSQPIEPTPQPEPTPEPAPAPEEGTTPQPEPAPEVEPTPEGETTPEVETPPEGEELPA